MTIGGYGVLRGRVTAKQDATKRSRHYQLRIQAARHDHRIAVNVMSLVRPHEVLYYLDHDYQHEITAQLLDATKDGFNALASQSGGLALDYVRGELFDTSRLRPIPAEAGTDNDMNKLLDAVVSRAIEDENAVVFAFGQRTAEGVHDIHMNQGNAPGHASEDGAWQDGGLFVYFPSARRWVAVFIAFHSQSFQTDVAGHAAGTPPGPRKAKKGAEMAPLGFSLAPSEVQVTKAALEPGEKFVSTEIPMPLTRSLRAYAFDPSRGRVLDNDMKIEVQYRPLAPGPVELGRDPDRIAVIDYDGHTQQYYKPVDLDDARILLGSGLWPSESDARFHQQMVYAVARETIEHFSSSLGRRLHWRRAERDVDAHGWKDEDILSLGLFPHAMRAPNAYYSPDAHGILFGYFAADRNNTTRTLPGQPVFTCLSHDVIVHEMTHAIVDGQRGFLLEQTNRDVAAFHEGFADLAALFRHFSHREVLLDTLRRTGGKLYNYQLRAQATSDAGAEPTRGQAKTPLQISAEIADSNPLIELALQFGDATGLQGALRSALGTAPSPDPYKNVTEPHQRGSILVAAVFDAFFSIYVKRTSDVFAVYRAGGGSGDPVDLPAPLANLLCDIAMDTADGFFQMCVRALDYCPPVDLTFGEYLRAMVTAEVDRDPDDPDGIREALMQAFRLRGIFPDGARFFSEDALCWSRGDELGLPLVRGLTFGDPNALSAQDRARIAPVLRGYFEDRTVRARLGFAPDLPVRVTSFHPVFRTHVDGSLRRDMVVEAVQTQPVSFDHDGRSRYPFRGGATLLIDSGSATGRVRWAVTKPMLTTGRGASKEATERHLRQQAYLTHLGLAGDLRGRDLHVDFRLVHGGI